jgi:hypothetical protein
VPPQVRKLPDKVNFDRLWAVALRSAIDKAGYEPIRTNEDTNLVLADVLIPNGNVYYEGHPARRSA